MGSAFLLVRSGYLTGEEVPIAQPVQFSHRHHAGDDGIDCRYCHTTVETAAFAGMPPSQTCMNCHSQIWNRSPALALVRDSYESGRPIEWNRVYNLPDYTHFDHSIHVNKGVGCDTCHGQVDDMPLMWKTSSLLMEWCLDCHRAPEKYVRPREQVFNQAYRPPTDQLALGRQLVQEYVIESKISCSVCHR